jgi:hypothetical protein
MERRCMMSSGRDIVDAMADLEPATFKPPTRRMQAGDSDLGQWLVIITKVVVSCILGLSRRILRGIRSQRATAAGLGHDGEIDTWQGYVNHSVSIYIR